MKALRLNPSRGNLRLPPLSHPFSSSDGDGGDDRSPPPPPAYSFLEEVKSSLQKPPTQKPPTPPPQRYPSQPPHTRPSKIASLEEIRKNLSEFRRRSAPPLPGAQDGSSSHESGGRDASSAPPISFQELYKSNVIGKGTEGADESKSGGKLSFESIRESLRQIRASSASARANRLRGSETLSPFSLKEFKDSLNLKPPAEASGTSSSVLGGTESVLPPSIFGREPREKTEAESRALKTKFMRMYTYGELGEKLKMLRPEVSASGKKGWFSLEELNDRLMKLREMEERETESKIGGLSFKDLRNSLLQMGESIDDSSKRSSMQRLALLGQLGGQITPSFMLSPPKDHLVEKYFHPDNMSSEEKLKLELKRVRDEFKMSESDCGSSRVQVAQLTSKIKHLSSVLHKKDKHSRRGLLAMVQRRKKLLKYLRRTDWDSYCLLLSKLGLRDNPDYKN